MLKHQFLPYGARSEPNEITTEEPIKVDTVPAVAVSPKKGTEEKTPKGKKRKMEGEPHKKPKKHKLKE